MKTINLAWGLHDFMKLPGDSKYGVDKWKCRKCGVIGLRVGFSQFIDVDQTVSDQIVHNCNLQTEMNKLNATHIIIYLDRSHPDLEIKSVHPLITPPPGKQHWNGGVWIAHPVDKHPILIPYGEFMIYWKDPTHTMVRAKKSEPTMTRLKRNPPPAPKMTRGKKEEIKPVMTRNKQKPLL
jgi:hypothetical protein